MAAQVEQAAIQARITALAQRVLTRRATPAQTIALTRRLIRAARITALAQRAATPRVMLAAQTIALARRVTRVAILGQTLDRPALTDRSLTSVSQLRQ